MTTIYDTVPYPRHAYGFTHPDRLATLAALAGLESPAVEQCRVLELGCASGSNLVPLAYAIPGSEFVGVDLSQRQVAEGQEFAAALGLKNIRLEAADIRAVDASWGRFDYIIAHGVYSWVPPDVRSAILRICGGQLSENGVALVSYNAMPGGHLREMVRRMAQFHVRDVDDLSERVDQTHALVRFLAESLGEDQTTYRMVLQSEAGRLAKVSPPFMLHDVLEEVNQSVYFHEFIEHAGVHGLQYLGEALPLDRRASRAAADVLRPLREECDPLEYEQHLDFLEGTAFRRTLLCRAQRGAVPFCSDRPGSPEPAESKTGDSSRPLWHRLLVASPARPAAATAEVHGDERAEFAARKDRLTASLRCDRPIAKAAVTLLGEIYPRAIPWTALASTAAQRLGRGAADDDERELREVVLGGFQVGAIELHRWQPPAVAEVSDRPEASAVVRYQISQGWEGTTLWHERIAFSDPLARQLLACLDGRHDRAAIAEHLVAAILAGQQSPNAAGPPRSEADIRAEVDQKLDAALRELARAAVLIG